MEITSGYLATEDSVEKKRGRLQEELNHFEMGTKKLEKFIFEKGAVMQGMSTCILDTEKK